MDTEQKYVVRLYDGFDNCWIDVSDPVSRKEADKIWNEKTDNGTKKTSYANIDYFSVFEADTIMLNSVEGNKKSGLKTMRD